METRNPPVTITPEDSSIISISKPRLRLLKTLQGKRRTVTELAHDTNQGKSTVHDHLQTLVHDGLIQRHDNDDRVWVYYSLTPRAEKILNHQKLTLTIDLSTLALFLTTAGLGLYQLLTPTPDATNGAGIQTQPPEPTGTPWLLIAYITALTLTLAGFLTHLYLKQTTPTLHTQPPNDTEPTPSRQNPP